MELRELREVGAKEERGERWVELPKTGGEGEGRRQIGGERNGIRD